MIISLFFTNDSKYEDSINLFQGSCMKHFLALCLLVATSSVFADEIIKVVDAGKAECSTLKDFLRYQTTAVYRPLKFVRGNGSSQLTVEFLKCVKTNEGFAFQRQGSIETSEVRVVKGPINDISQTVLVERKGVTLIAYNSTGRILARSVAMRGDDGTYVADLEIDHNQMDSTFAGSKFEFSLYTVIKITDAETGALIDSGREFLGSYALIVR